MEEMLPQQPQIPPVSAPQTTQPVFYSLSAELETPRSTPWFKKRQLVAMAVSALVLMAIVAGVIVFAMNAMRAGTDAKKVVEQKTTQVEQLIQNGSSQSEAARLAGFVEGCKGLDDGPYANCVSLIAFDTANPDACAALSDVEKTTCVDRANTALATKDGKFAACSKVTDQTLRAGCEALVMEKARAANDCKSFGVPEEVCAVAPGAAAVASGDITACSSLPTEEQAGCLDVFYSTDTDADGISDGNELTKYHTDPKNPDTDGDGYTDGDEVASGHDPLKK